MSDFLCIVMTSATAGTLVVLATIHPIGCMERSKAVLGCMVDRYCGGTFYPPAHHGTKCSYDKKFPLKIVEACKFSRKLAYT